MEFYTSEESANDADIVKACKLRFNVRDLSMTGDTTVIDLVLSLCTFYGGAKVERSKSRKDHLKPKLKQL